VAEAVAAEEPVRVMVVVQLVEEAAGDPAKVGSPVGSGADSEVSEASVEVGALEAWAVELPVA
jgi:hypothetical protein